MKAIIIIICCSVLLLSCSSGEYVVSKNGDQADVILKNSRRITAEIIYVTDTSVVLSKVLSPITGNPYFFYALKQDIESIKIKGFDGGSWFGSVILFQILPAVLLTVASASSETSDDITGSVALASLLPAIFTSLFFAATEVPPPGWNDKSPIEKIDELKIYAKYPEGLSQEQLDQMLNKLRIKEIPRFN